MNAVAAGNQRVKTSDLRIGNYILFDGVLPELIIRGLKLRYNYNFKASGYSTTAIVKNVQVYDGDCKNLYLQVIWNGQREQDLCFRVGNDEELPCRVLAGDELANAKQMFIDYYTNNLSEALAAKCPYIWAKFSLFVEDAVKDKRIPGYLISDKTKTHIGIDYNNTFLASVLRNSGISAAYYQNANVKSSGLRLSYYSGGYNACIEEYHCKMSAGMRMMNDLAIKHNPNARLSLNTTMTYPKVFPAEQMVENDSENIYGLKREDVNFQCGEFNIMFSTCNSSFDVPEVVKALDAIVGVACVALFDGFDAKRRRSAVLAGDFSQTKRDKTHTLEYRVLSNAALMHPFITNLLIGLARRVVILANLNLRHLWKASEEEVLEAINNSNVSLAKEILLRNKDLFIKILKSEYRYLERDDNHMNLNFNESTFRDRATECLINVFVNGAGSIINEPKNINKNWLIDSAWIDYGRTQNVANNLAKLMEGQKI